MFPTVATPENRTEARPNRQGRLTNRGRMSEPALAAPQESDPAPTATVPGETAPEPEVVDDKGPSPAEPGDGSRGPSYVFFGSLAAVTLLADVATKAWAEIVLTTRPPHDP